MPASLSFQCAVALVLLAFQGPVCFAQVLHYTFDEAATGNAPAEDYGDAPYAPGTFIAGATRTPNGVGNSIAARDLTANGGKGNFVNAGDIDALDSLSGLTITMWVNIRAQISSTTTLASDLSNIPIPVGSGGWDFGIGNRNPADAVVTITIWDHVSGEGVGSLQHFNADHQWVMIAGTLDMARLIKRVYWGTPSSPVIAAGIESEISKQQLLPNNSPFLLGGSPFSSPTAPVWIDDVRIYDRPLSLAELDAVRVSALPEPTSASVLLVLLVMTRRRLPASAK